MKEYFNWEFLSKFGKNKLVKRTYVFMFIVPFIISILTKLNLVNVIDSIPFSWHALFYSAVFFTIGNILYEIFSPSIVKENYSFTDFQAAKKNWDHMNKYSDKLKLPFNEYLLYYRKYKSDRGIQHDFDVVENDYLETVESNKKELYKFLFDYYRGQKTAIPSDRYNFGQEISAELRYSQYRDYKDDLEKNNESNLSIVFWKLYEYAKYRNKSAIIFSFIFYFIGLLLISIVTANSILIVIKSDAFSLFKQVIPE